MSFLGIWFTSYFNPGRAVGELSHKPAPQWGLVGVLIRCALVSFFWYLPAYLMGRTPSMPPRISVVPGDTYYAAMVLVFPIVTIAFWLIDGVLAHTVLRVLGRPSNFAAILNIDGFGNLVIAPILLAWDWITLALGWGVKRYCGVRPT